MRNSKVINFRQFIKSLTPEQIEAFRSYLLDNLDNAVRKETTKNPDYEKFWKGFGEAFKAMLAEIDSEE